MPRMLEQADEYLPNELMRAIGALRTYAARLNFFLGVPNTLMIGVLFYHQSAIARSLFPTVYHWVGFILFVVVPVAIFADRFLLHPAQITYNAHQGSREDRNPTYQELMKVSRQLDHLEGRLRDFEPGDRRSSG